MIDPHSYAESFIAEDAVKAAARARGVEIGTHDVSPGTGAYLPLSTTTQRAICRRGRNWIRSGISLVTRWNDCKRNFDIH